MVNKIPPHLNRVTTLYLVREIPQYLVKILNKSLELFGPSCHPIAKNMRYIFVLSFSKKNSKLDYMIRLHQCHVVTEGRTQELS